VCYMKIKCPLVNGKMVDGEELRVVEIGGKEYLIFMIDYPNGSFDLDACYVVKDAWGADQLRPINNPEDYRKIRAWIDKQVAEYDADEENGERDMNLWTYGERIPEDFDERNYELFILGPMLHGKTSVTKEDTYYSVHKPSGIFSYEMKGTPGGNGARWLKLPKIINIKTNFGMTIPMNISISQTFTRDKLSSMAGNAKLYKYYTIQCTASWSADVCRRLQNLVKEKAEHIYCARRNILEEIYNRVLESCRIGAKVYIGKAGIYADNKQWDYASVGLKELNTIQIYGLALALEKYMQQTGKRRTLTHLMVYSGAIEFWLERTPGLEEW